MKCRSFSKGIPFLALILCGVLLLSSCYYIDTNEKDEYASFMEDLGNDRGFSAYLPAVDKQNCIDDMYLYFSDYDLLDSFYTIYVRCVYSKTEYEAERERILSLYDERDHTINSDSFGYQSVVFDDILVTESEVVDYLYYSYVLFDRDEGEIVYVMLFAKDDISKIDNVPVEYLPEEYIEFVQGAEQSGVAMLAEVE